jgi:hypothetical protein
MIGMVSRGVLAVALLMGFGWATTLAQPASPATIGVSAGALEASSMIGPTTALPGAAHFGPDSSRLAAQALKLAANDDLGLTSTRGTGATATTAASPESDSLDTPRGWVLVGAGVWLIATVLRRRKRSAVF